MNKIFPFLKARNSAQTPANAESNQLEVASQWQLMWWKFRHHKLAMASTVVVLAYYFVALFGGFFAPTYFETYNPSYLFAPPQPIHFIRDGNFAPYALGLTFERDPISFRQKWSIDEKAVIPLGFFVHGDSYKLLGFIPSDLHFIGAVNKDDPFFLMGADKSGRDVLSRIIYSSQISLTVGLVGVIITLLLGILIGGISGLVGGTADNLIQRLIEILISIPTLPLWLAMGAVVPLDWSPLQVYFMITVILSLVSWMGLARVVRSKFLSLRQEDFILAATLDGVPRGRMIFNHMVPSFLSHIIATVTLAIPGMILGETALSYLGLGLRPPNVSWGVMLQDAQQVVVIATYPWLLFPAVAIIIIVLALNFMGDGLRDAADPY